MTSVPRFRTIAEVEQYLVGFYAKASAIIGKDITLERMWPLLEVAGNPHEKLRVIHVAGTSGKTSTSYFCAELLRSSGARVGLTVSPHIESITERLQIDGKPMAEDDFCRYFSVFIELFGDGEIDASYFELMITFVLWVFVVERVDYAVLETGLGGRFDCTNVCQRADKVCVLTDIGYDHMAVLGDSLPQIAAQKAGIIHPDNHAFCFDQGDEIVDVFRARARDMGATLHVIDDPKLDETLDLALFQQRNWELARQAIRFVATRDGLMLQEDQVASLQVPGRMQVLQREQTTFILDGAHNPQKMQALVDSLRVKYPDQKLALIMAMKQDKDFEHTIEILAPLIDRVYCVEFEVNQDFPHKSVPSETLAAAWYVRSVPAESLTSLAQAIHKVTQSKEPVCLVTGSLYIIGDVLRKL